MYNEERKRRYIKIKEDTVTLPYRSLDLLFEKTEPFEEKLGKDVCEWTAAEIMEYYKYRDAYSLSSLVVCNSNLTQYTNWCLTETLVPRELMKEDDLDVERTIIKYIDDINKRYQVEEIKSMTVFLRKYRQYFNS